MPHNFSMIRILLLLLVVIASVPAAIAQQAYVDIGPGILIKGPANKTVGRINAGIHNIMGERFGFYSTIEAGKAGEGSYFRDIFGVNARVSRMFEVYGGMGLFKDGFITKGLSFQGVRKEVGVTAYLEALHLSIDLGISASSGPSVNIGYVIPMGSKFNRGEKKFKELQFPLETIYAETDRHLFRELCSKITFSLSTGKGWHHFSHEIKGVGVYQSDTLGPLLVGTNLPRPPSGVSSWISDVKTRDLPQQTAPGEFLTIPDTSFRFDSRTTGVPYQLQASVKVRKFRVGAGIGFDIVRNSVFRQNIPTGQAAELPLANNLIRPVSLSKGDISISRFFGYAGYDFYKIGKFSFSADLMAGRVYPGRNFNAAVVTPGLFYNGGLNTRFQLSEYVSLFVRPSLERKNYTVNTGLPVPEIRHNINSTYLNFGINYSVPALPRCYISACRAQLDHGHGNRQYRSRVHPFFRKQNPGYGENKVRVKPNRVRMVKDGAIPR